MREVLSGDEVGGQPRGGGEWLAGAWSPTGEHIVFGRWNYSTNEQHMPIGVVKPDGSGLRVLLERVSPYSVHTFGFSADGQFVSVSVFNQGDCSGIHAHCAVLGAGPLPPGTAA